MNPFILIYHDSSNSCQVSFNGGRNLPPGDPSAPKPCNKSQIGFSFISSKLRVINNLFCRLSDA